MYILVFILGIIIGSFLNVCIYRIPRKESIAFPPSHCTACSHQLKWYDLIPIFSFLSLRGKCRYCGGVISPQYPIIEFINGLLFLLIFYHFDFTLDFIFYSFIISTLLVISIIDYYHQIIPDGLVIIIFIAEIVHKAVNYFVLSAPIALLDSIFGFFLGGVLFLLIALLSNGGMGGGDIKLIAVLGFILGLKTTLLNIFLSFIIGAVFSILLLALKIKGRKEAIPFGPFINLAFLIAILFGDKIILWYIQSFLM